MTTAHSFIIEIDYDPECQRWYVAETELPGLILEDADPGRLVSRLVIAAPELLELNAVYPDNGVLAHDQGAFSIVPTFRTPISLPEPVTSSQHHDPAFAPHGAGGR